MVKICNICSDTGTYNVGLQMLQPSTTSVGTNAVSQKKPTKIVVTKNVVTSIAIQHMLVKNCTPTFSYNILFNKVVIFCANQHQPYNNIFEMLYCSVPQNNQHQKLL